MGLSVYINVPPFSGRVLIVIDSVVGWPSVRAHHTRKLHFRLSPTHASMATYQIFRGVSAIYSFLADEGCGVFREYFPKGTSVSVKS